jgi:hypothetical protein
VTDVPSGSACWCAVDGCIPTAKPALVTQTIVANRAILRIAIHFPLPQMLSCVSACHSRARPPPPTYAVWKASKNIGASGCTRISIDRAPSRIGRPRTNIPVVQCGIRQTKYDENGALKTNVYFVSDANLAAQGRAGTRLKRVHRTDVMVAVTSQGDDTIVIWIGTDERSSKGLSLCENPYVGSRSWWPAPRVDTEGYVRPRPLVANVWAGRSALALCCSRAERRRRCICIQAGSASCPLWTCTSRDEHNGPLSYAFRLAVASISTFKVGALASQVLLFLLI